eukprot:181164-Pleurochrysis_carterae.AAC.5
MNDCTRYAASRVLSQPTRRQRRGGGPLAVDAEDEALDGAAGGIWRRHATQSGRVARPRIRGDESTLFGASAEI